MKTFALTEFQALVERTDWMHEQELEHTGMDVEDWNDDGLFEGKVNFGSATKISILGDLKITYNESYHCTPFNADSLSAGTDGQSEVWAFEGFRVVDEDGDELDADYVCICSNEADMPSAFSEIDYDELDLNESIDIDTDEDSAMETFTLEIDNAPNLRFTGERIGEASTSGDSGRGDFSGKTGRWTELALYKTRGGRYVCHQIGRTAFTNERDRFSGKVCDTVEEVKDFFGHRWLAKELYDDAGIDHAVEIE